MALRRKLTTPLEAWNEPRRAKVWMPLGAGLGGAAGSFAGSTLLAETVGAAVTAGTGAGLGAVLAWVGAAALD